MEILLLSIWVVLLILLTANIICDVIILRRMKRIKTALDECNEEMLKVIEPDVVELTFPPNIKIGFITETEDK